jgi:hypothetical protein
VVTFVRVDDKGPVFVCGKVWHEIFGVIIC